MSTVKSNGIQTGDSTDKDLERSARFSSKSSASAARLTPKVQRSRTLKFGRAKFGGLKNIAVNAARPRVAPARENSRRAFVRIRYVSSKSAGHWGAHGDYLEREGAQVEGEKGVGFDKAGNEVSVSKTAREWQADGDDKIFKITLSPEDGDRLNLEDYTKKFMARIEEQTGQPLDWVAIQHNNTEHPHVHILLRGKGVELSKDLISKDAREIAQDEATKSLGYRSQKEINRAKDKEISQRRFTSLDTNIKKIAVEIPDNDKHAPGYFVQPKAPAFLKNTAEEVKRHSQQVGRLNALCEIGVAEKVGHLTYKLEPGWEKALKELEILQTRSTMLMQHRELMTDSRCQPVVTKLKEGELLTGRVLGTGLDEKTDNSYLLVEGTDGKAHIIYQNKKIEQLRGEQQLQPGSLISIEAKPIKDAPGRTYLDIKEYGTNVPAKGFTRVEIPIEILDNDLKNRDKYNKGLPNPPASVGIAGVYQKALLDRAPEFEQIKAEKEAAKLAREAAYQAQKEQWAQEKIEREQKKAERDAAYQAQKEIWAKEKAEREAKKALRQKDKGDEII